MSCQDKRWMVGGTTKDEGWKILSENKYIGNEDDGYDREWIATVYSEENAKYIVDLHNLSLATLNAHKKRIKKPKGAVKKFKRR